MASKEDIIKSMKMFEEAKPHRAFDELNKMDVGFMAVLKYLSEKNREVSSKDISDHLGVSSSRMTILLKKLENKKLINKINDPNDARSINVSISNEGKNYALDMKNKMFNCMGNIIDEIGIEDLEIFIKNVNTIKSILEENKIENMGE